MDKLLERLVTKNNNDSLRVPTIINKIDDTYYIVDCNNNNILYSKDINATLTQWNKIPGTFLHPHCFVGDGTFFIVVDTENNRLATYKKENDSFIFIESIDNIGFRPHYAMYHDEHYYVWNGVNQIYVYTEKYDTDYTDLVRCKDLSLLATGEYESLYDEFGLKSSPYYVYMFDDSYYMAALSGYNAIYRLDNIDGEISCVQIY